MSLRINNNITALDALRNLNATNDSMSSSITRLSTGLRIVSAADDPSGLVLSENMRAQIKGMTQASANTQNAINMTKTADGAMNEVQTMLSDMRALAVESANSAVVDSTQLAANQNEITSTLSSIQRVATTTQWGSKKLLDGTAGVTSNITDLDDVSSAYLGSTFNDMTVASGPLTVQVTSKAAQASLTTNKTFSSAASVPTAGSFVINGTTFTANGTTDSLSSLATEINAQTSNTGVTASVVTSGSTSQIKLTSTQYGSAYKVDLVDTSGVLSSTPNPTDTVAGADAIASVTATVLDKNGNKVTTTNTFTGGKGDNGNGLSLTDDNNNRIMLTSAGNDGSSLTTPMTVGAVTTGSVQFQIGANAGQAVTFAMPNIQTTNLGTDAVSGMSLADLDVTTTAGANKAIEILDAAITQLSSMRGDLGSFQKNVLETNDSTLTVANENVTAAESTVRDADLAGEMTNYTKYQILQQSGTAMLAQANQIPNQVLKLLQS